MLWLRPRRLMRHWRWRHCRDKSFLTRHFWHLACHLNPDLRLSKLWFSGCRIKMPLIIHILSKLKVFQIVLKHLFCYSSNCLRAIIRCLISAMCSFSCRYRQPPNMTLAMIVRIIHSHHSDDGAEWRMIASIIT